MSCSIDDVSPSRRSFNRSRSPIPRIKQLFSLKPSPTIYTAPAAQANAFPTELIAKVGQHVSSLRDVLNISLTCRRARAALISTLYTSVELKTNRHCKVTLEAFARQPEITQCICTLIIRPNNVERTVSGDCIQETLVANLIILIADCLPLLRSFCWDGLEMPDTKLWSSLQKSCPLLKCIATSIGSQPLNSSDYLFDFRDLHKFTLAVKSNSLKWLSDGRPDVEKLPRRFWQMILERCPNLEDLTIGGSAPSPRVFDARHLTTGRWPRLRELTLGDVIILPAGQNKTPEANEALNKFLIAHPSLRHLAFQHPGSSGFPPSLALLRSALSRLESFTGPPRYIKSLPNPNHIKKLAITTLHHAHSAFPPTCAIIQGLPSLTWLTIWIDLSFSNRNIPHDDGNLFRTLLENCPQLLHLEVLCFTRPSFHVKEFSAALRYSPQLQSFSLTKIHKSSDEEMIHTAVRIAHDNPNIQKFSLQYSQDSWLTHSSGRVKQFGNYEILIGTDGLPVSLSAYEWGARSFGQTYSRNYSQPLKPPKLRRGSRSSHSSWSSSEQRAISPRPQSIVSFTPSVPMYIK